MRADNFDRRADRALASDVQLRVAPRQPRPGAVPYVSAEANIARTVSFRSVYLTRKLTPPLMIVTTVPMTLFLVRGQAGFMRTRGFDVHALSSPAEGLKRFAADEGVEVHEVEMPRWITPARDLVALARIVCVMQRVRPVIVHSHTPKGGLLGMIGAWLVRIPVRVYCVQGLPLETAHGFRRTLLRWSERTSCRLAHRVICVGHSLADVLVKEGVCPREKVRVFLGGSGNGVDASGRFDPGKVGERAGAEVRARHGIPRHAVVVGYVGRIVRDKGLVELAKAWETLRSRFPNLHLMVVGPFEPQDPVPAEVEQQLRTDERIHLVGEVGDVRIPPYYAAMDVHVLPTHREGFPNVVLEAASMGLPVVATRVTGCVDAVEDGVTGRLVPARDPVALAKALGEYVADESLRRDHGHAGRKRVLEQFRQEPIWECLYEQYMRLLQAQQVPVSRPEGRR